MYDRTRDEGFGPEVKRRIMLGTYVLSAGLLRRVLPEGAAGPDADSPRLRARPSKRSTSIAMPTSPTPAFKLGERTDDPLQMYLADVFTVGANLAGPAGASASRAG